jgi:chorismate mutase
MTALACVPVPRLRGLRGATTLDADDPRLVDEAVIELLGALLDANDLDADDVVSAIFSATPDLRSRHPAAAARTIGWTDVPMLCVAEMDVDEPLARCVRVLLHVSVHDGRRLRPIYLRGARCLRPDLGDHEQAGEVGAAHQGRRSTARDGKV